VFLLSISLPEWRRVSFSWFDFLFPSRLERRWFLWHQFMNEHAQLDTWLRLAEQAVGSPHPAHLTYVTAKEEMRKFEVRRNLN